jgi:hypothetical protein
MVFTSSCETKQSSIKRTSKEFITAILTKDYKNAETYLFDKYYEFSYRAKNREELYQYFDFINSKIKIQNVLFNEYEFENDNYTIVYNSFDNTKIIISFKKNNLFGYSIFNFYI